MLVPSNVWVSALSDHWPLVVVDVLAIAFAIIFWKIGLAVDARAKAGELNSVWSEISDEGEVIQVHIDLDRYGPELLLPRRIFQTTHYSIHQL